MTTTQNDETKLAEMEARHLEYEKYLKQKEIDDARELAEDEANKDKFTHICLKVYLNRVFDLVWPNGVPEFEEIFEKEFGYEFSGMDFDNSNDTYIIYSFTKPLKDMDYFYNIKGLSYDLFAELHSLIVGPFAVGFDVNAYRSSEDTEIISHDYHQFMVERHGVSSF